METSRRTTARNEDSVASSCERLQAKWAELEPLRPECACGCGERLQIPTIARKTSVEYIQRYWQKHPTKQNHYKVLSLTDKLAELEKYKPCCACGCGEQLGIPQHMLTRSQPASIAGIQSHWRRHPYQQGHGIWATRTHNFVNNLEPLSSETLGLIYGTLLGDCSITYPNRHSRFPRLSWTHGIQQQAWLEYKAERLAGLRPKLRTTINRGYGQQSACGSTACHPQLSEVFQVVKPSGKQKKVSQNWLQQLTPEGLAWWYMDDGSLTLTPQGSPQIQLHTEGYSANENQLIAEWLTEIGYPTNVRSYTRASKGKIYYYLAMGADTSRKWLSDLQQYAIPSMDYKFGAGRVCPPRWG